MITTDEAHQPPYAHPEHTFLATKQVFARYGWGRTRGYQMIATEDFPPRIGGSFRLDTLLAWEDRELKRQMGAKTGSATAAEAATADQPNATDLPGRNKTAAPVTASTPVADPPPTLPGRRRPRTPKVVS